MASILPVALIGMSSAHASVVRQFDLSSVYNIDGVANIGDFTQSSLDQPNAGGNYVFMTQSLAATLSSDPDGLRDDGIYTTNALHPTMHLGYGDNPNGNNVLQFAGTTTGTTRNVDIQNGMYSEIHVAAMSGGGSSGMRLRLNYSDGAVLLAAVTVDDWFNDIVETADRYYIDNTRDRVHPDQTGYQNSNDPAIFGYRFLTDVTRTLLSFDIIALNTASTEPRLNVFGATGVAVPEPASLCFLLIGGAAMFARRRRILRQ